MKKDGSGTVLHNILKRSFDVEALELEARRSVFKPSDFHLNITSRNLDCHKIKNEVASQVYDTMKAFWTVLLRDCLHNKRSMTSYQFLFTYSPNLIRLEASNAGQVESEVGFKSAYYELVEYLNFESGLNLAPSVSQFDVYTSLLLDITGH